MADPVDEFAVSRLFGRAAGLEGGPQDTLDVPQIFHSPLENQTAILDQALDLPADAAEAWRWPSIRVTSSSVKPVASAARMNRSRSNASSP